MNVNREELFPPLPGLFLEFRETDAFTPTPPAFRPRPADIAEVLLGIDALYAVTGS